jgi:hypothetical protein
MIVMFRVEVIHVVAIPLLPSEDGATTALAHWTQKSYSH